MEKLAGPRPNGVRAGADFKLSLDEGAMVVRAEAAVQAGQHGQFSEPGAVYFERPEPI